MTVAFYLPSPRRRAGVAAITCHSHPHLPGAVHRHRCVQCEVLCLLGVFNATGGARAAARAHYLDGCNQEKRL